MRAMIVSILVPDDWSTTDVCSACHIGIRKHAEKEGKYLSAMDYNAMVIDKFKLAKEADHETKTP
jgi:hypothetical protein